MKKTYLIFVFIFSIACVFLIPHLTAQAQESLADSEPVISMDFQDVGIKNVLKLLSMQSGMNFIASEAVADRKITLYFDKVPLGQAMDKIFSANNLSYELDSKANIFVVKDWGKMDVETITKVFYLKHASVSTSSIKQEGSDNLGTTSSTSSSSGKSSSGSSGSSGSSSSSSSNGKWKTEAESGITYAVKKILSPKGSLVEDFRTNSLIVTDTPARMKTAAQVIASLDIEIPQIMLEVEMLDVNKNVLDKLGVKYQNDLTSSLFTAVIKGATISTGFPIPNKIINGLNENIFTPGSVDFSSGTTTTFDFIRQNSDAKILARPKIMTLNNETAEIKITTDEVIGVKTTQEGTGDTSANRTTTAERTETGVTLRVTPQINTETGEITMFIYPSVRAATQSSFQGYKDAEQRSTKSTVRIKDGETVVIGGLIRYDKSETVTKLPILGDIPVIGALFRHKEKDRDRERELLVFITPYIVKSGQVKLEQIQRFSLPIREQSTVTNVNRDYLVNSSLNNFDKKR